MRTWIVLAIAASAAAASADRLIYIPTARKIPFRTFKYELRAEPRFQGEVEHYLGIGLTTSWELEVRSQKLGLERPQTTFDLTYNYLAPLTGFTPGIAAGVQDIANKTAEGTRPFLAITFREGFQAINGEFPADITIGMSLAQKRLYPIVGASIPFSAGVRLMAEHDGFRISAGFEIHPIKPLALRFIVREKSSLFGLVFQHRF
jgi:hypothetical protein